MQPWLTLPRPTSPAFMPSFRYADWEVTPLIPFERDVELSLDDALARARAGS